MGASGDAALSSSKPPSAPVRVAGVGRRARDAAAGLLDRFHPGRAPALLLTAVVVGCGTGLAAVGFIELIGTIQRTAFGWGPTGAAWMTWLLLFLPAAGSVVAGPILAWFAPEARGHGVPEVMKALALHGGRLRPRLVLAKIAASALCIGTGGSAGREGPIVQVGSAWGSTVGGALRLSTARVRNLVACGAAAGIAATFNAPIAGTIFSVEVLLGEFQVSDLGNVIVSAVAGSTVARTFLGDRPAFSIPPLAMRGPIEVLLFVLLGIVAALVGIGFIRALYAAEDRFDAWRAPAFVKPVVGTLLLSAVSVLLALVLASGLVSPAEAAGARPGGGDVAYLFGSGFPVIQAALLGRLSLAILLAFVLLKPIATAFTLGAGNSGGVFAPLLCTGAALGGAFGSLVDLVAPGATAGSGAFATVGMAAVFGGAARAPLTAILIVFEMTDDIHLIVPLMTAVITSVLLSERLHPESIYTLKLARGGVRLRRGSDVDVMESVTVDEVMVRDPATVPVDLPVAELPRAFLETGRHGFAVVDAERRLLGIVSLEDYRRLVETTREPHPGLRVLDIATRHVVTVFPDQSVGFALRRMAPRDLSRLPVVDREHPERLVGMIRRNDIVRAYEVGLVRREDRAATP